MRKLLSCLDDPGLAEAWAALIIGIILIYARVVYVIYSAIITDI
jgi:uncharacterized membrane protein YecN with MAPEG domain